MTINEEDWIVPEFYTALFDYCFPVDYRMQLQKMLARCHQNDKSVAEYTHELQDLFNMIGNIPKQDQVLKFWNSARPSIQKELWRNKLNLELSSWKRVVAQAEIIEIAENVAERRDRKTGQNSQASRSVGNNPRHKPQPTDGSVRAVTFGSHRKHRDRHRNKPTHNSHTSSGQQRSSTPYSRDGTPADRAKSRNGSVPVGHHYTNNRFTHRKAPQLSDKEKAEYRAASSSYQAVSNGPG